MTYTDVAKLALDQDFTKRVAACYAIVTLQNPQHMLAATWARDHNWDVAAQPGFGDAYAYALAQGNPKPGVDTSVISDEMLLAGVNAVLTVTPNGGGQQQT